MNMLQYIKLTGRELAARVKTELFPPLLIDFFARQGVNVGGLLWLSGWLYRSCYATTIPGPFNETIGSWMNLASTLVALFLGHTKFGYPAAMAMGGVGTLVFWSGRAANLELPAFAASALILSAALPVIAEPWAQKTAELKLNDLRATESELMKRKKRLKLKEFYYATFARDRVYAARYMYAYNVLMGFCDYFADHGENLPVYAGSILGNIAAEFSDPEKAVPFKVFARRAVEMAQRTLRLKKTL